MYSWATIQISINSPIILLYEQKLYHQLYMKLGLTTNLVTIKIYFEPTPKLFFFISIVSNKRQNTS